MYAHALVAAWGTPVWWIGAHCSSVNSCASTGSEDLLPGTYFVFVFLGIYLKYTNYMLLLFFFNFNF